YILANNITKPIRILDRAMSRLPSGDLETRISQQGRDREDVLSNLALQFDKMAQQLQKLVEKERHLLHHVSHEMRSPLARMQAI
ncbi:HAMP domain-containing protein, partial [Klebsiella pneumoniae]|uniref:HAMP domain-containing protein n=1 Tax=Klebsiella pneumoniae TaxID=573 RepID=UPI003B5B6969